MSICIICGKNEYTLFDLPKYVCNKCMEAERKRLSIETTPEGVWEGIY